jgi:hypothetical protein
MLVFKEGSLMRKNLNWEARMRSKQQQLPTISAFTRRQKKKKKNKQTKTVARWPVARPSVNILIF